MFTSNGFMAGDWANAERERARLTQTANRRIGILTVEGFWGTGRRMPHVAGGVRQLVVLAGTAIAASAAMRKLTPLLFAAALIAATACEQRTETQTVTDTTGT